MRAPTHQAGIATPQLRHGAIGAFDVQEPEVFANWTVEAETLMREGAMTVTIGSDALHRFGTPRWQQHGTRSALVAIPPGASRPHGLAHLLLYAQ